MTAHHQSVIRRPIYILPGALSLLFATDGASCIRFTAALTDTCPSATSSAITFIPNFAINQLTTAQSLC
jgi:hypothetical protein